MEQKRLDRPELRRKEIGDLINGFVNNQSFTPKDLDQILALIPDIEDSAVLVGKFIGMGWTPPEELRMKLEEAEKQERERITSIIKEYKLESASVRDDMLELRARGWKLLWQALKEEK